MTGTLGDTTVHLPDLRLSWSLAPRADIAACVTVRSGRPSLLEVRDHGVVRTHEVPGLSPMSQLVVLDTGTVLACHHGRGRHIVTRTTTDGVTTTVLDAGGPALWLLAAPTEDDVLAVAPDGERTRVHTLTGRLLAEVSGAGRRGVRLTSGRLALTVGRSRGSEVVDLDLATGSVSPLLSVHPTSSDAVVEVAGGLVVVATDTAGPIRLGFGRLEGMPVRFPAQLAADESVEFLGCSPDGGLIALDARRGALSRIRLVDTGTLAVRDVEPDSPLVTMGRARVAADGLTVPVSLPDRPGTQLRVDLSTGRTSLDDPPLPGAPPVAVTTVAGIECVVLGDPASAPTVVLALHGGPVDAWTAGFDPLLAGLARSGSAVVAPNVRGSSGYGPAHTAAIRGRWGGPDLDDVLAVAAEVTRSRRPDRRRPVLVGTSYGAFLALLAAQTAPRAFAAVSALCPFVSGRRVRAGGGPIAALVEALGGTESPDLRDRARAVRCPVQIVHGRHDDVVPVAEAQLLHASLAAAGVPVQLHVADAGHDLLNAPVRDDVLTRVVEFVHETREGGDHS